tara:strand:- start:2090 stop:3097 length:1008 start_codon:yes stop_codon:yes gene_type:complete
MALTYSSYESFKEVEAAYNNITPLRGEQNRGKDIRPIGDRARKHERIVKINSNCYVLQDGYNYGCNLTGHWRYPAARSTDQDDKLMVEYAPIVWRKHRDGSETVTLRNGTGPSNHNGRYAFLYRHTPKGMWFRSRNGKHFIEVGLGHYYEPENKYFLAKQMKVPVEVYEEAKTRQNRWNKWMQKREQSPALTFKNLGNGNWEYVSGGKEIPTPPRTVINKTLKDALKPHIAEFRDWSFAMVPMLPMNQMDFVQRMRSEAKEYVKASYGWNMDSIMADRPETCRDILKNSEHPLRVHLAYTIFNDFDSEDSTRKQVLTHFNRKINKLCGLTKVIKG